MEQLAEVVAQLYGVPLPEFVPARTEAAKASDKELAKLIKNLRKPSVAAWAVNLLVRREPEQVSQAIEVGQALRAAAHQLQADQLRELSRQRRQVTAALAHEAADIARLEGQPLTGQVLDQVQDTLTAAMLDELAAQAVQSGALISALRATGVEPTEVAQALAWPEAIGMVAPATGRPRAKLSVVPEPEPDLRAKEEALARVSRARAELKIARQVQTGAGDKAAEVDAAILQVQAEIDELTRKLAELEAEAESLDEDAAGIREAQVMADEEVAGAEAELADAESALDALS